MAQSSSATKVSYDVRPAKQTERRIILDLISIGGNNGFDFSNYRYIGLGANRFYDFLLIHKYIGINKMISLERDADMYKRALYNCPYSFIDVINIEVGDFIAKDNFDKNSIVWLDYDSTLSENIISDISSLATKLKLGDFCFVTIAAMPPGIIAKEANSKTRLEWLNDTFTNLALDVNLDDVTNTKFPIAVHKILIATFKNAFTHLIDLEFVPFLQVGYNDGAKMITIGGMIASNEEVTSLKEKIKNKMPFLPLEDSELYQINSLHLTERERILFDKAVTKSRKNSKEVNKLNELGFDENHLKSYRELLRYLPRYVETII